jgi:hypothetical protein
MKRDGISGEMSSSLIREGFYNEEPIAQEMKSLG